MRRDVYIENDSGGFSVVACDAVDAIIEDARGDDFRFVQDHKAMLIELYGDDSMPIRIVVDEPLTADEEAQWLARYTGQLDTSDGRMLVMGGFDPDVLSWWKDEGGSGDGRGIGAVEAKPGKWRVDVYAHVGSMNGRAILDEGDERPGAAFRRDHPGRAFPLWLAKLLDHSGDDDPGHEELWKDVKKSFDAGKLAVDTDSGDAIGFLVHFARASQPIDPPEEAWIGRSENARIPKTFPLGLKSDVPDPDLRALHDELLEIVREEPPRPVGTDFHDIMETWPGDPTESIEGGSVTVPLDEMYLLHWIAALATDTVPRFELWVTPKGAWTPPQSTSDFVTKTKDNGRVIAIGPVLNTGGWHTWWTSRAVAQALGAIPDGSTMELAAAPDDEERIDPDSVAGRVLYGGVVRDGQWQVGEASPKVERGTLEQALTFLRDLLFDNRMQVREGDERKAFDTVAEMFSPEADSLRWKGDVVSLAEPDERMHLLLSPPVFRRRFADAWPMDADDEDGDGD